MVLLKSSAILNDALQLAKILEMVRISTLAKIAESPFSRLTFSHTFVLMTTFLIVVTPFLD